MIPRAKVNMISTEQPPQLASLAAVRSGLVPTPDTTLPERRPCSEEAACSRLDSVSLDSVAMSRDFCRTFMPYMPHTPAVQYIPRYRGKKAIIWGFEAAKAGLGANFHAWAGDLARFAPKALRRLYSSFILKVCPTALIRIRSTGFPCLSAHSSPTGAAGPRRTVFERE